jgi:hypothetical protein
MFTDVSEEYFSLEGQRRYKGAVTKKETEVFNRITPRHIAKFSTLQHFIS